MVEDDEGSTGFQDSDDRDEQLRCRLQEQRDERVAHESVLAEEEMRELIGLLAKVQEGERLLPVEECGSVGAVCDLSVEQLGEGRSHREGAGRLTERRKDGKALGSGEQRERNEGECR